MNRTQYVESSMVTNTPLGVDVNITENDYKSNRGVINYGESVKPTPLSLRSGSNGNQIITGVEQRITSSKPSVDSHGS